MYVFRQYGTKQLQNLVVRVRSLWNGCECLKLLTVSLSRRSAWEWVLNNEEVNCWEKHVSWQISQSALLFYPSVCRRQKWLYRSCNSYCCHQSIWCAWRASGRTLVRQTAQLLIQCATLGTHIPVSGAQQIEVHKITLCTSCSLQLLQEVQAWWCFRRNSSDVFCPFQVVWTHGLQGVWMLILYRRLCRWATNLAVDLLGSNR